MLESTVESAIAEKVEAKGGLYYKFKVPGRRHVPDRLVLLPITNPAHAAIVAEYFYFMEAKAPGKKPSRGQLAEHKRLRDRGYRVDVIDKKERSTKENEGFRFKKSKLHKTCVSDNQ